jgi:hypothetical protein
MIFKTLLKSISFIIAIALTIGSASAYNWKTHALSAKLAAELVKRLDAAAKRYAEIYDPTIILQLGKGAWEEDFGNVDGNNRAFRHYYDPDSTAKTKGVPYYRHYQLWKYAEKGTEVTPPPGWKYPGALEWARDGAVDNWSSANPFNWEGAIRAYDYTHSSRSEAYYRLGHVIHLLTDMAEPDHALNIPHAGSSKGLPDTIEEITHKKLLDSLLADEKARDLSVSEVKTTWLNFVIKMKQMAHRSRRVGYELLIDDAIHPNFVEEFFTGENQKLLVKSETTWSSLPPIKGNQSAGLNSFDDLFNSLARRSKLEVQDRNKYPMPLGIDDLKWYLPVKELIYPFEPIYLIPAIAMNDKEEVQKYYALAWILLDKATEYNANLLMHFHDIVNPPPYVKEVRVTQDGQVKYRGYWEDIHGIPAGTENTQDPHLSYAVVKKRELKNPLNKGIMHGKKARVEIEFGPDLGVPENIDESSVKVTIGGTTVQGSIKNSKNRNIWEGIFPVPKLREDEENKIMQISISASDADMHYTYGPIPGYTLDSDPLYPAKVQYQGKSQFRWNSYESMKKSDTNHKIKIVKEEEVLPFEFYFSSVTQGTGPPYSEDVWYYTYLSTNTEVWVQLLEKETWCISRDKPNFSWYKKEVQKNGFYEIYAGTPANIEIPPQGDKLDYSKSDGQSSELDLFKLDENEKFERRYTSMDGNRITAPGPYGGLSDESKIYRWIYRGRGKDGKIYEAELVFDFQREWEVDYTTENRIIYKSRKEKE